MSSPLYGDSNTRLLLLLLALILPLVAGANEKLILQGTEDMRVGLAEGRHMVERLRGNGNPTTYLEVEGGSQTSQSGWSGSLTGLKARDCQLAIIPNRRDDCLSIDHLDEEVLQYLQYIARRIINT